MRRTVESHGDKLQAHVAETNVEACCGAAWPYARNVEPARHNRFLGIWRLGPSGTRYGRGVRIYRVVSWPVLGEQVEDERCEGELDNHMHTCREQWKGKDNVGFAVLALEHPFVVLHLSLVELGGKGAEYTHQRDRDGKDIPHANQCRIGHDLTQKGLLRYPLLLLPLRTVRLSTRHNPLIQQRVLPFPLPSLPPIPTRQTSLLIVFQPIFRQQVFQLQIIRTRHLRSTREIAVVAKFPTGGVWI